MLSKAFSHLCEVLRKAFALLNPPDVAPGRRNESLECWKSEIFFVCVCKLCL